MKDILRTTALCFIVILLAYILINIVGTCSSDWRHLSTPYPP